MKNINKNVVVIYTFLLFLTGIIFTAFKPVDYSPPESGTNITSTTDINNYISYTNAFPSKMMGTMFTHTYSFNGYDIYNYMQAVGCYSIAVCNGYNLANNYNDNNKAVVLLPLDANYKVMPNAQCLKYVGNTNMSIIAKNFGTETTIPASLPRLPYVANADAQKCISNYSANTQRDPIRQIIMPRSTLDKIIKNNTNGVLFNLRLHHAFDASSQRIVIASAINYFTGLNHQSYAMQVNRSSSLCPTNCDFN